MICPVCGCDMVCKRKNEMLEYWFCGCRKPRQDPVASKRARGPTRTRRWLTAAGCLLGRRRKHRW